MKMLTRLVTPIFFHVLFCLSPCAEAQFGIPRAVIGGGGCPASNGSFTIVGTAAQPFIGAAVDASGQVLSGFWYTFSTTPMGADPMPAAEGFFAGPVYPNPCTGSERTAAFEFRAARKCVVTLCVFSLPGDRILLTSEREMVPGRHKIVFPVESLSAGMYVCETTARDSDMRSSAPFRATLKLIVAR